MIIKEENGEKRLLSDKEALNIVDQKVINEVNAGKDVYVGNTRFYACKVLDE